MWCARRASGSAKLWWRAVSPSITSADGRPVAAYDLSDESPQLTDYLPQHAEAADIADVGGQMALFDGLIAGEEMPKVIDVGHRAFWRFFAVVHRIGFFDEARLHGIEPVILFVTDADPRAEKAFALLRCSFPDLSLLPVRNRAVMKGQGETFPHLGALDTGTLDANALAASLEIAELPSLLRGLVDRPGFSFADFPHGASATLSAKSRGELLRFIQRFHAQLRDIELGLVNGEALAGLHGSRICNPSFRGGAQHRTRNPETALKRELYS
jgi:hypothetical protein